MLLLDILKNIKKKMLIQFNFRQIQNQVKRFQLKNKKI